VGLAQHAHWLDTSFDGGTTLLTAWAEWLAMPESADQRLIYSALAEQPVPALPALTAPATGVAQALWQELQTRWTGMAPGLHRLHLQGGRLALNVWVLGGRTTREDALRQACGVPVHRVLSEPGAAQPRLNSHRTWAGRTPLASPALGRHAVVVGGGLSGAAVAYSLGTRGWQVEVLDQASAPASGASGLPLGLVAPHVSPDDALLSRLTRAGVRATLQRAEALLTAGETWCLSGSLERRLEHRRALPSAPDPATLACQQQWSRNATASELAAAHLPPDSEALWHQYAGWVQPAALVQAQLRHPGIVWRGEQQVSSLQRVGVDRASQEWVLLDAQGRTLAQAPVVVLATAYATRTLLQGLQETHPTLPAPPYNPLRGQVSWGPLPKAIGGSPAAPTLLPPWPVHGHGSFMHGPGGHWIVGSTFERGATHSRTTPEDHALNQDRLAVLLPELAASPTGAALFREPRGWAGVRCTLPDRLPTLGEPDPANAPGLLLCAGMGARGLTLSVLCGEVLAAALHQEPWPLEDRLVRALRAERFEPARA
jgi:tRNA 5-methylaminomethyl-2-thiouridine biosynthesis bifunctional protein